VKIKPETRWRLFDLLGYKVYHEEVRRFHNSEAKTKVCYAPRRSTKSYASAKEILPIVIAPGTRTWIVGPNYGLAEKEFNYVHKDLVVNRKRIGMPKPRICHTNSRSGSLYIKWIHKLPNPNTGELEDVETIVEGKSADNPQSLLGEAVDAVIYSEAAQLPRAIRERYVKPTLITRRGIEIIPTTPDCMGEWVNELFEKGQAGQHGIEAFHWDVTANPEYNIQEFNEAKAFYGENHPVFREQYLGESVFYGGRVYPNFMADTHVIEPFKIPEGWKRIRAIDFGGRDPFVCLWIAVGPNMELYLYREYYIRESPSMREHASNIKGLSSGEYISLTVGDPSEKQSIDDLCFEGIPVVPANNDRMAGRLRLMEYVLPTKDAVNPYPLKDKRVEGKQPRLFVFRDCKETIREFNYYRWVEAGKRMGEKERTEGEDHAMDALRYGVMTRPAPFHIIPKIRQNTFDGYMNRIKSQKMRNQFIGV
jgi:hypothetical protein